MTMVTAFVVLSSRTFSWLLALVQNNFGVWYSLIFSVSSCAVGFLERSWVAVAVAPCRIISSNPAHTPHSCWWNIYTAEMKVIWSKPRTLCYRALTRQLMPPP